MHVVATAGHVDHGKSTLVAALTGQQPDRLAEERRRGLSIELGYCWTELPGVGDVAFVDVPGHERFIATMLTGVGPVPAVLFVVAADDPWMPQAAEHLAALDALGVLHCVVAVTRSDLADPAPMLQRARDELSVTTLADAELVAVSGRTGEGLDRLRSALTEMVTGLSTPDPGADVRLWLDRRFHVRGAGTVVTGTLTEGTIRPGDELLVDGDPASVARVRGAESLGRSVQSVTGVARVALDLGGRAPGRLDRGSVLVSPDAFLAADVVDVRLHGEGRVPERPLLHVGATSVAVHVRPLDDELVRLTLDRRLPLRVGDRALLRDPGSRQLWGVQVLDPAPPPLGRRGAARRRAAELGPVDGSLASELDRRGVVRASLLRRIGVATDDVPVGTIRNDDWLISPGRAAELRGELAAAVRASSTALQPGVPVAALAHTLDLPDERLVPALVEPPMEVREGRVAPGFDEAVPDALRGALSALEADLAGAPFLAPGADRLRELGLDARALAVLNRLGRVLRVADGVVLLPGADELAAVRLRSLPQPFTTSQARQALGTSRRVVLPLLAHLDRTGVTRRLPDDTRTIRAD